MASKKHTPSARPKQLAPELLTGAFIEERIEERIGEGGRETEYRMFFPKAILRGRAQGELGRDRCGPFTYDVALRKEDGALQHFFGAVIDASVAEELKGQVPHIQTSGSPENRVDQIKAGIRQFRIVELLRSRHPEIAEIIADHGCLIQTLWGSSPPVLLLPPERIEQVETALCDVAPEAGLARKSEKTDHPFTVAQGLEMDHPALKEIVSKLVPSQRVAFHFNAETMQSVAHEKPEAESLKASIAEKPELLKLLENKAYFLVPRQYIFNSSLQFNGAIVFADAQDAAQCEALLQMIPGFGRVKLAGNTVPPFVNFPKLTLLECDTKLSQLLSGFAGEIGDNELKLRRKASDAGALLELIKVEHPDHEQFQEKPAFRLF